MGLIVSVAVPLAVPSQNVTQYSHWTKYRKIRDQWMVRLLASLGRAPTPATKRRLVRVISYRSRLLDDANLVGGAKPIPDCLQRLGWLVDDNPKWFKGEYDQIQESGRQKNPLTEIEIHTL